MNANDVTLEESSFDLEDGATDSSPNGVHLSCLVFEREELMPPKIRCKRPHLNLVQDLCASKPNKLGPYRSRQAVNIAILGVLAMLYVVVENYRGKEREENNCRG